MKILRSFENRAPGRYTVVCLSVCAVDRQEKRRVAGLPLSTLLTPRTGYQSISQFTKQQGTKGQLQVASVYNSHSARSTDNLYSMDKIVLRKKPCTVYVKFNRKCG